MGSRRGNALAHLRRRLDAETAASALVAAAILVFFAFAALVAATLPYRSWDAYFYGRWSRLIGLHGGFYFDALGAVDLHRPLFYVLVGELWRVFGYHMALGRFASLAFTVLLVGSVAWLAAGRGRHRLLRASLGAGVTTAAVPVAFHASDGLTDEPTAALLALAACALWRLDPGRGRTALLLAASLAAVLAKPSGIVGIAALILAHAVGPRIGLARRFVDSAPAAAGLLIGLGYDWLQAHRLGMRLDLFLHSGVGAGLWADKAAAARPDALVGWGWLGDGLHVTLVFAVAYAVLRSARLPHRVSALAAAPVAWIWAWLGPALGTTAFAPALDAPGVAVYATAALLPLAALAPEAVVPTRTHALRLLVWAAPSLVVWFWFAAYDVRLLSAAWPAFFVLIADAFAMVALGAAHIRRPLVLAPMAAVAVLVAWNSFQIDGLGAAGWHQYRASSPGNERGMENVALGQFQAELDALRARVGPHTKIVGGDGRLDFFFPGQVSYAFPKSCSELRGYGLFVLLLSDESIAQARAIGAPASVDAWAHCTSPPVSLVSETESLYALFAVGAARKSAECTVPEPPDGLVAVFGSAETAGTAERLRKRVASVGFVQAEVLPRSCEHYLVVEEPVPNKSVGASIAAEGRRVGVDIDIRRLVR